MQRLLDVDHVGSAGQRGQGFVSGSNADQQLGHVMGLERIRRAGTSRTRWTSTGISASRGRVIRCTARSKTGARPKSKAVPSRSAAIVLPKKGIAWV